MFRVFFDGLISSRVWHEATWSISTEGILLVHGRATPALNLSPPIYTPVLTKNTQHSLDSSLYFSIQKSSVLTVPAMLLPHKATVFTFSRLYSRTQELFEGSTWCIFAGNMQYKNFKDEKIRSSFFYWWKGVAHSRLTQVNIQTYISWHISGPWSYRWHPRCVAQSGTYLCWAKAVCGSYSDGENFLSILPSVGIMACFLKMCRSRSEVTLIYIFFLAVWELFAEVLQTSQCWGVTVPGTSLLQSWQNEGM